MNFIPITLDNNKFSINGINFELDNEILAKLNGKSELIVGIRSENMVKGETSITAVTDIVEMNGGEKTVYFNLNDAKCSAKIDLNYNVDGNVELKLSVKDMYFFDSLTEENLLYIV